MPLFDLYPNPNQRATHGLYLDVQSALFSTSLWGFMATEVTLPMTRSRWAAVVVGPSWVVDTPNVLAVPNALLQQQRGHLAADD